MSGCRHAGSLLFNPINAALLDNFDFRVAFRCPSGTVLVTEAKDWPHHTSRTGYTTLHWLKTRLHHTAWRSAVRRPWC